MLTAEGSRYVVEAKWLVDISDEQGSSKNQTQLDFRSHVARAEGEQYQSTGVIVIIPSPGRYPPARKEGSVFRRYFDVSNNDEYIPTEAANNLDARAISWEQFSDILNECTGHDQTINYLKWRLSFLD